MANPTGSVYLQANNSYVWTDGDIYEIPQTDEIEGAASNASFSGLGVDNQPHQVLLNKIQYLHSHQVTDEANIAALQSQAALITSNVGANGWLKLGTNDTNLGTIQIIIQWGSISLIPYGGPAGQPLPIPLSFNFPIAFPNAVWLLLPYYQGNNTAPLVSSLGIAAISPLQKQGNQIISSMTATTAQNLISRGSTAGLTGIGWVALGY
jgi:hypothetical protein